MKLNPSSKSMLFTSFKFFALFVMAIPFLLESRWSWLSFACCGKNLCSPYGIISFSGGYKFFLFFCYTTSNGCCSRISFSISYCKISLYNSWWYCFSCWCPISPIYLMITTTSSFNVGSLSSTL